jgi:P-type Ca2+ transporter type 2C
MPQIQSVKINKSRAVGLSGAEAAQRLLEFGPNTLPEPRPLSFWQRLLKQFSSPLIYILLFALVFDAGQWYFEGATGIPLEAMVILLILGMNAGLGVAQEYRSERALTRLKEMSAPQVWTLRDGNFGRIPSSDLVPEDVVSLEAGDRVPADAKLLEHETGILNFTLDESVLTGESLPLEKAAGDEIFAGTLVVRGHALAQVVRTGSHSAMGKLAALLGSVQTGKTPLETRLDAFSGLVAKWVLGIAVLIAVGGIVTEGIAHASEVVLFAVALAVAAVPEGLPAVLTLTLALGVERMVRRRAVVRRLASVETLGSVTVIATDKTGTLTENRMRVRHLETPDLERAHLAMVLANDADLETGIGDPLELGLLEYARTHGHQEDAIANLNSMRNVYRRVAERPFDSAWKFMRVTVEKDGEQISFLKGAPEVLLERTQFTPADRSRWLDKAEEYARQGYRVLALATGHGEVENDLEFLGLVMLWDPPRAEVLGAIQSSIQAGVRVLMITGDHPATALAVAQQIGIRADRALTGIELDALEPYEFGRTVREVNVFARVTPEHKLRIVETLKSQGEIIAVTGDGVNDAPALKRADIGLAMSQRGSDVAREVADVVITDDNFATIIAALEEGRTIGENVRSFVRFMFGTNLAEVLVIALGAILSVVFGLRDGDGQRLVPLTATMILWINLLTDGLPALALAFDRHPEAMTHTHIGSSLLDRASMRFVLTVGVLVAGIALCLLWALPRFGFDYNATRSAVFHFMALSQLLLVFSARQVHIRPERNMLLIAFSSLGVLVQVLVGTLPWAALSLGAVTIPLDGWIVVVCAALLVWSMVELLTHVVPKKHRK